MNWKKITPTFILGMFAIVFGYDTLAQFNGQHATISEATTTWLYANPSHSLLFIGGVLVLIAHFFFSKYPKE